MTRVPLTPPACDVPGCTLEADAMYFKTPRGGDPLAALLCDEHGYEAVRDGWSTSRAGNRL